MIRAPRLARPGLTPALAREASRMGALRARSGMGDCACKAARTMGALGDATSDAFAAEMKARVDALSGSAKATLLAQTGVDVDQARVAQGASAAVTLAQNGWHPGSSQDDAMMVHVISGGLCLIPGVGPILGASTEALFQVAQVLACPVTNAFASVGMAVRCDAPPCVTNGPPVTAQSVLDASYLPPRPTGSFAAMVLPALAAYAAAAGNCKPSLPASLIVEAVRLMWNEVHAGPAVPYYVPAMNQGGMRPNLWPAVPLITTWNSGGSASEPNVAHAFQPLPSSLANPSAWRWPGWGLPLPSPWGIGIPGVNAIVSPPGVAMVNSGPLLPPPPPPHKQITLHLPSSLVASAAASTPTHAKGALQPTLPKPMTTGGKVAAGAAVAGAGVLAWWLGAHGWRWVSPRWMGKAGRLLR